MIRQIKEPETAPYPIIKWLKEVHTNRETEFQEHKNRGTLTDWRSQKHSKEADYEKITTNKKHKISLWMDKIKVQSAEKHQQERKVQLQKTGTRGKENIKTKHENQKLTAPTTNNRQNIRRRPTQELRISDEQKLEKGTQLMTTNKSETQMSPRKKEPKLGRKQSTQNGLELDRKKLVIPGKRHKTQNPLQDTTPKLTREQ